ncbi:hypothetical protein PoB_003132600 [Plakobranchus ocellatus]|uniref:Uncharacterized protein n=1 Tax=Plakobranchus ocellatus TaxID=259542 RepID=A0AAV4A962_9GAST|nr:hypothetical protein PoB_003132600 [Plakobranchus ocellatus]
MPGMEFISVIRWSGQITLRSGGAGQLTKVDSMASKICHGYYMDDCVKICATSMFNELKKKNNKKNMFALKTKRRPTLEAAVNVSNNTCFEIVSFFGESATCRSVEAILCVLQPGVTSLALLDKGKGGAITDHA